MLSKMESVCWQNLMGILVNVPTGGLKPARSMSRNYTPGLCGRQRSSCRGRTAGSQWRLHIMERVGTYFVENFGCRATQADGAAIERQLLDRGLVRAGSPGEAEVVVLNTCTVTASADRDARSAIRRIHRENPGTRILVTGCYAQRAPEELSSLPGVSRVVGNSHKHAVADYAVPLTAARGFVPLDQISSAGESNVIIGDIFAHTELLAAPVFDGDVSAEKTRPNL